MIDEVASVPRGKQDDLPDTVSMVLLYLRNVRTGEAAEEGDRPEPDNKLAFAKKLQQERSIAESYRVNPACFHRK